MLKFIVPTDFIIKQEKICESVAYLFFLSKSGRIKNCDIC
jgi:hypothetical protein